MKLAPRATWAALAAERASRRVEEALRRRAAPRRAVPVDLRSPLGHPLPARLHLPDGPGPHPAVLLCPGGIDGIRGTEALSPVLTAPRLAREGFATLAWGPSGREGAPGPEDRNGPLHQAEAVAALEALLARPEVDPARVAVASMSFGLVLAAGALHARPDLARRVRVLVDWEGPSSRRWFQARRLRYWTVDEGWWQAREAVRMAPGLECPYWRFQSVWDHVHGTDVGLGREMAEAAAGGRSPDVRLNGAPPPFTDDPGGPLWPREQAAVMVGWLREATGR